MVPELKLQVLSKYNNHKITTSAEYYEGQNKYFQGIIGLKFRQLLFYPIEFRFPDTNIKYNFENSALKQKTQDHRLLHLLLALYIRTDC